jgi:hypothetical protein
MFSEELITDVMEQTGHTINTDRLTFSEALDRDPVTLAKVSNFPHDSQFSQSHNGNRQNKWQRSQQTVTDAATIATMARGRPILTPFKPFPTVEK